MALIPFEYWFSENNRKRSCTLDDATAIVSGSQGAIVDPGEASDAVGDVVYSDAFFEVYAIREAPYAIARKLSGCGTTPSFGSITTENVGGLYDITIPFLNATALKLYGKAGNPDSPTFALSTSPKVVSGYPPGQYLVVLFTAATGCNAVELLTVVPDMVANVSHTNETADGLDDGSITLQVTDGSGQYTITWHDATTTNLSSGLNPQQGTKSGLAPGTYTVTVEDLISGQTLEFEVEITASLAEIPPGSLLEVPSMNSLHFVVEQTPDGCDIFQTLDNVLFCKQVHPHFTKSNYYQKVCKCDQPAIQFNSDFQNHTVDLRDYRTGTIVKSFPVELKEENIGAKESFDITIRNHTTPGQSRVYFNVGDFPIPLTVEDPFEILDNLDGFDGNYTIVAILTDVTLGYNYIVINKNYAIAAPQTSATGRFLSSTADFNVYEFLLAVLDVSDGHYYVTIRAFDDDDNFKVATSEPIDLKVSHPDTNLVVYRNFDNAFGMTWTTGIICRIRVESIFFKRLPGGERTVTRNSNFSLVKVSAKKTRGILFETFALPPYLHEKLSVLFDCDFKSINSVEVESNEGYNEPVYLTRYMLSNSSIKLEAKQWFDNYNSDDLGTVADSGGLLLVEETGFLKL